MDVPRPPRDGRVAPGAALSTISSMSTSLVGTDAIGHWSADACRTVLQTLTASLDLGTHREAILDTMLWMHAGASALGERVRSWTGRPYHESPQHLLALAHSFVEIVTEQCERMEDQQRFRLVGLEKLRGTVEQVESLQQTLAKKRTRLAAANAEANDRLQRMVEQQQAAESEREASVALQAELQAQEAAVEAQRAAVLAELAAAEPAVLDAQAAVSNIKKQHLSEMRAMTNPPAPVKLTMESVCMLLNHHVDGWKSVQSILRRDDFISTVVHLDTARDVPRALRERVQREYLARPEYQLEAIYRASTACGPLASWVMAQVHYADMLERIAPLRREVAHLEGHAVDTRAAAAAADDKAAALAASIAVYKREYAALISETQALTAELEAVEARVARSVELLRGLEGERQRWDAGRASFQAQRATVLGDALLCAASVAFAGFFDQAGREALWHAWRQRLDAGGVPAHPQLTLADALSTADERAAWHAAGLPADALHIDNAVMLQRCTRVPLLIDPSGRAAAFVQAWYSTPSVPVAVSSFLDESCAQVLERALRFGTPLVLTHAEHWDPLVLPILNREKRHTGGRVLVRVGAADVDWAPTFRLILTTRDTSVSLPPSVFARVQTINFTMTRKSLQAQALTQWLRSEQPETEAQRDVLVRERSELQRRLSRLEQALLTALHDTSEEHLLEDERVVATLESLKAEADDVAAQAARAADVMHTIDAVTAAYEPLAEASSALYFLREHLGALHPFYQFDMPSFQRALDRARVLEPTSGPDDERRDALYRHLFVTLYTHTAPSLLASDHLVWALALATLYGARGPHAGAWDGSDALALLHDQRTTPTHAWIERERHANAGAWDAWLASPSPESAPLPLAPRAHESEFDGLLRRALVVQAYRADRLAPALAACVHALLGAPLLATPPPPLLDTARGVPSHVPIALCGVAGYDASAAVEQCAATHAVPCAAVALGAPDATAAADRLLGDAAKAGTWVLVKNAHLAPAWLAELPARLTALQPHEACRAWVTCDITPSVPSAFLRPAHVVMYEPPVGLRASLVAALAALDAHAPSRPNDAERERVYVLVAIVHAIALERARHAPHGWSRAYEFYDTDLLAALDAVDACWAARADGDAVPWPDVRLLLQHSVYGGRMDTDADHAMLAALLAHVLCADALEASFVIAPHATQPWTAPASFRRADAQAWAAQLPDPTPIHWLLLAPATERAGAAHAARRALEAWQTLQLRAQRDDAAALDAAALDARALDARARGAAWAPLAAVRDRVQDALRALDAADTPAPDATAPLARFWARERAMARDTLDAVERGLALLASSPAAPEAVALARALTAQEVPASWRVHAAPRAPRLDAWLDALERQARQAAAATPETWDVHVAWLGAPGAFLTATRQWVARAHATSVEQLHLHLHVGAPPPLPAWNVGRISVDAAAYDAEQQHVLLGDGTTTYADAAWLVWTDTRPAPASPLAVPVYLDAARTQRLMDTTWALAPSSSATLAVLWAVAVVVAPPP